MRLLIKRTRASIARTNRTIRKSVLFSGLTTAAKVGQVINFALWIWSFV